MTNKKTAKSTAKAYTNSEQFNQDRDTVLDAISTMQISANDVARTASISSTTLSLVLAGTYKGDVRKNMTSALKAVETIRDQRRQSGVMPFVETSVFKTIRGVCADAFASRMTDSIGLISAYVGVGKTTAIKHIERTSPHVIYMRAIKGLTAKSVLARLVKKLELAPTGKSVPDLHHAIVDELEARPKLLLLDQADRAVPAVMEALRDVADEAESSLVFCGRESLAQLFVSNQGELGEISSRIMTRVPVITCNTLADINLIIDASALAGIDEDARAELIKCSENNARVLEHMTTKCSNLLRGRGQITAQDINTIYRMTVKVTRRLSEV